MLASDTMSSGLSIIANLILTTPWGMICCCCSSHTEQEAESSIYSRSHSKAEMKPEPHTVSLTPDTKLLAAHCVLKSSTQQKVTRVFEQGLLVSGLPAEQLGGSFCILLRRVSVCRTWHLCLSTCYNFDSRDRMEIFRMWPLLGGALDVWCFILQGTLPSWELQPGEAFRTGGGFTIFSLISKGCVWSTDVKGQFSACCPLTQNCHFVIELCDLGIICNFYES